MTFPVRRHAPNTYRADGRHPETSRAQKLHRHARAPKQPCLLADWNILTQEISERRKLRENAHRQWRTEGGGWFGVFKPPPEIPKPLQNRVKLNPIVKTVKNC